MKKTKKLLTLILAVLLMVSIFPAVSARAASTSPKFDDEQYAVMLSKGQTYSFYIGELKKNDKILKANIKSSNSKVASIYSVSRNKNISLEKNLEEKKGSNESKWENYNYNITIKMKKPGKTVISFKVNKKTYKATINVIKYSNPLKTAKITGLGKGNLASRLNKHHYTNFKPVKKKKIVLNNLEKGVKYDLRVRCVSTGKKTKYGKWSKKKTCKTFRYNPKDFAGRWKCLYEVGDPEIGPTWLELEIRPNGKFHTVDIGAGNPGIAGTYKQYSDKTVHINCSKDGDFDPYLKKLKRVANIRFKVISNDELHFTYKNGKKNSTLVFVRSKTA